MNDYVLMGWRQARRVVVLVIGSTLILLGLVGILLPIMPGSIFIPLGLAILATEFVWAQRWLRQIKQKSQQVWDSVSGRNHPPGGREEAPPSARSNTGPDMGSKP